MDKQDKNTQVAPAKRWSATPGSREDLREREDVMFNTDDK